MAEETTFQFLTRRRQALLAQTSALRGQLAPMESELAQVEKLLDQIEPPTAPVALNAAVTNYVEGLMPFLGFENVQETANALVKIQEQIASTPTIPAEKLESIRKAIDALTGAIGKAIKVPSETMAAMAAFQDSLAPLRDPKYAKMTIKELVIQALIDHFPNGGTLTEIRNFIQLGYGRAIEPASLRPQMHRLKADEILFQVGDVWNLNTAKRQIYMRYDHPTSRAAMKELKDEPEQRNYAQELRDQFGSTFDPDHPDFPRSPNDIPNNPPLPATPKTRLGQIGNEEADRIAQKEAKRARKRVIDDILE
jgi:hypothetical protein